MKKQILTFAGVLSLLFAAGSAYAQVVHVKGNIPFEFKVVDKTLPAGQYSLISSELNSHTVRVVNENGATVALIAANDVALPRAAEDTVLVFHRYGDRYFLAGLRTNGEDTTWEFPRGKAEREEAQRIEYQDTLVASATR